MNVKVLGDAPAMAMANLYQVWAGRLGESREATGQDLLQSLLKPPSSESPQSSGHDSLFADMPAETFDWSDSARSGGSRDGGGRDRGHNGSAHDAAGGDGVATALSLFKGFGHGDLDF